MFPIDESMLSQLACDVCGTMLDVVLAGPVSANADAVRWIASVQISGEIAATVEIETDLVIARWIACRMFFIDVFDVEEDHLRDALGEIVNVIGGNLKGILSGGECDLSLPNVEETCSLPVADADHTVVARLSCEGLPFIVRLTETRSAALTA